jgi:alcohol dehydrogenase (NADP+)
MLKTKAYAAKSATSPIAPFEFERREVGPNDVLIEISHCGICHSDIHQARDEWGGATFPMVPGHEIVGRISKVGKKVKKFRVGDHAGVGCFVESCGKCKNCKAHEEQYCEKHCAFTYNSTEMDGKTQTQGGYSSQIVVHQNYALRVSKKAPLDRVAPLLCAGITTYSPLKRHGVKKGQKVGVVGLGGLGHMAVKIAKAMGAEVTVFSTSPNKEKDAKKLGAKHFIVTKDPKNFEKVAGTFDFILDTVSAPHDLNPYLISLRRDAVLCLVGVPPKPAEVPAFNLINGRKTITGSLIGGIKETQEMLDFCTKKKIFSDVEVIPAKMINEAYERTIKGDVKYRFVIDMKTL